MPILYGFLINAILGALLSGFSLALFSPYVTLRRISYLGEALSHIAFAGIAIALITGLNFTITTLAFVILVALAIGRLAERRKLDETNSITIFLSVSMALGIVLISLKRGYTFDLSSYLFGNVLMVNSTDLISLAVMATLNAIFISVFYKQLFYLTYNPEIARVFRVPTQLTNRLFLILLAANIVISLKTAGIILVSAQLILPAAIAANLTRKFRSVLVICLAAAVISSLGGFALSWWLNLPTGATIVILEFFLYLLSLSLRKKF